MMNIILLGAPGAGKGTLASGLSNFYRIPHISTGSLIRKEIDKKTELGCSVVEFNQRGQLLPDTPEYMGKLYQILKNRLSESDCRFGFILEGTPRTAWQIDQLDTIFQNLNKQINAIILLDVEHNIAISRILDRLICKTCDITYHRKSRPPKVLETCDRCQNRLTQRSDDSFEIVQDRLRRYQLEIMPIIERYRSRNFYRLNANKNSEDILTIAKALVYRRDYLENFIRKYPQSKAKFPIYNVTDIYMNPPLIRHIVGDFEEKLKELDPDFLAAPEARSLPIFGALLFETSKPGILIRKAGKLAETAPRRRTKYSTAYSSEELEIICDDSLKGKTVAIIDDGISSGGTTLAVIRLLQDAGAKIIGILTVIKYHYRELVPEYKPWQVITHSLFDLGRTNDQSL